MTNDQTPINERQAYGGNCAANAKDTCSIGNAERPVSAVLVGDSHAGHLVKGLNSLMRSRNSRGLGVISFSTCLFFDEVLSLRDGRPYHDCERKKNQMRDELAGNSRALIIAQYWSIVDPSFRTAC